MEDFFPPHSICSSSTSTLGCLSLEFVKVNLALISSFNKIKCLLSGVVYSAQGTGFYGFSMLYFPRTLCHVLHPIINSTQQWPWFSHNLFLIPFTLFCSIKICSFQGHQTSWLLFPPSQSPCLYLSRCPLCPSSSFHSSPSWVDSRTK